MLNIETDSYVTIAESDEYIGKRYRSDSKDRTRWDGLAEEDREILLRQACAAMELLPYRGRKAVRDQPLAFPRLPMQYGQPQEPPAAVKAAQVELALWLSDDDTQTKRGSRQILQEQGVKAFAVGDLSETFADGAGGQPLALSCPKAAALLAAYTGGGYDLC